jgi:hypothetical protein
VQKALLDTYPHANLKVYAVWFSMMPNDSRAKWSANLLMDSRVIHRWDEPKAVGTWFAPRTEAIRPDLAPNSAWGKGDALGCLPVVRRECAMGRRAHWSDSLGPDHCGRPRGVEGRL